MGKILHIKNHKKFNPKRNVERISRPKLRLRGYSSQNDGKNCQFYISAFGRRYNEKFSKEEREMTLHIRDLFSDNGERTEYFSRSNSIILIMGNDNCKQPISITFMHSFLIIYSLNDVLNKCIPKIHLHIYQLDIAKKED